MVLGLGSTNVTKFKFRDFEYILMCLSALFWHLVGSNPSSSNCCRTGNFSHLHPREQLMILDVFSLPLPLQEIRIYENMYPEMCLPFSCVLVLVGNDVKILYIIIMLVPSGVGIRHSTEQREIGILITLCTRQRIPSSGERGFPFVGTDGKTWFIDMILDGDVIIAK